VGGLAPERHYNRPVGMWRSLVSARRLGRRGRRFESGHPDGSSQTIGDGEAREPAETVAAQRELRDLTAALLWRHAPPLVL
jgi:hypothetical protein